MDEDAARADVQQTVAAGEAPGDAAALLGRVGSEPGPSRTPRVLGILVLVLLVLAGVYLGAQWLVGDKVPRGTTVAGVDIGGRTVADAESTLRAGLADRVQEPVQVRAGKEKASIDPEKAGLSVDVEATVEPLVSFGLEPRRLWAAYFGGHEVDPVVRVDTAALDRELGGVADKVEVAPLDGAVTISDGSATSRAPRDGSELDVPAARAAVARGWLRTDGPIELPVTVVHPEVGEDATQKAVVQAGTITSAPVDVTVGDVTARLPGDVVGAAVTFGADGSALVPTADGAALRTAVIERTKGLVTKAKDASFRFEKGKPVVVAAKQGTDVDPAALGTAVLEAALQGSGRTASVEPVRTDPGLTTDAAEKLGVKTVVSQFATPLTPEPVRTQNLKVGAARVTGDLLRPGDTYSLLDALAPITRAGGYQAAHVISDGQIVEGVGGGLSQMATTTYNAAFFAGIDLVAHKPHTYWFSRYPEGRESTIAVPSVDMKVRNDTPYGIVVRAWVGGDKLHVQLWSTPYYTVSTTTSPRRDVKPRTTVTRTGPGCVADPGGSPGFTVTVTRTVKKDGTTVKDESSTWTYRPQDTVVCK